MNNHTVAQMTDEQLSILAVKHCLDWNDDHEETYRFNLAGLRAALSAVQADQQPAVPVQTDDELLPHLRQYMHNDGSGLVFGYDKLGVDQEFALLRKRTAESTQKAKTYTREEVQRWRDDVAHAAADMVQRALPEGEGWEWLVSGVRGLAAAPVKVDTAVPAGPMNESNLPALPFTAISTKQNGSLYTVEDMHKYALAAIAAVHSGQGTIEPLCWLLVDENTGDYRECEAGAGTAVYAAVPADQGAIDKEYERGFIDGQMKTDAMRQKWNAAEAKCVALAAALVRAEDALKTTAQQVEQQAAMAAQPAEPCKHDRQSTTALGAITGTGWKCKDCGVLISDKPAPDAVPQPAEPVASLHDEGSFYEVAKARGFTDFGLTIHGNYSDEKLQSLREQYDVGFAAHTPVEPKGLSAAFSAMEQANRDSLLAAPAAEQRHYDDYAVDEFAKMMKAKLKYSREVKGRGGWSDPEQCSVEYLNRLLHEHVEKGDPVDVANLCMMLCGHDARITPLYAAAQPAQAQYKIPKGWQLVPIVPTEPMRKAPWNDTPLAIEPDDACDIWAAMLKVAPTHAAAPDSAAPAAEGKV